MDNNKTIKIMQWNIKSIHSNYWNVIKIINQENPDVMLLEETWLKTENSFRVRQYNIITNNRLDGKCGVATLIRKKYSISGNKKQ